MTLRKALPYGLATGLVLAASATADPPSEARQVVSLPGAPLDLNAGFEFSSKSTPPRWDAPVSVAGEDRPFSFDDVSLAMMQAAADAAADADADAATKDAATAATPAAPEGHDSLAGAATNPIASLVQVQLQNQFIPNSYGANGYSNVFTLQPVIPFSLGEMQWVTRTTLPVITTPDLGSTNALEGTTGLGDLVVLALNTYQIKSDKWGGMWGVGPAFTFPTATEDLTGSGKWQAGPAAIYINLANPKLQWGVLAYQQWSIGGQSDRRGVSKLFFQPILTYHFGDGWYAGTGDLLWTVDWNDNARWTLPLSVKVGKVTKIGSQPVNVFVEPFYTVGNPAPGTGEWGIKISLSLLFPQG